LSAPGRDACRKTVDRIFSGPINDRRPTRDDGRFKEIGAEHGRNGAKRIVAALGSQRHGVQPSF